MKYWLISFKKFFIVIFNYIWHIFFNVENYTYEFRLFVAKDFLKYDYIRNALISITTSYLITILIKWDTVRSLLLMVTLFLSWLSLFISTLLFLKIFFVLKNAEEGWKATKDKMCLVDYKFIHSVSKIELCNDEIEKLNNNQDSVIELQSKRWIQLIRIILCLLVISILLLISSSLLGFFHKESLSKLLNKIEKISIIERKIDRLELQVNSHHVDQCRQYDSLRTSMKRLIK